MIDTLVFSGGGIKGIGFIGALEAMNDENIYNYSKINTFIGTSAGSIMATFLAIGYSIAEIREIGLCVNFGKVRDITAENIFNFFEEFGIDSGRELSRVMEIIIKKKLKENLTFKELYDYTGKNLIINAVCLNDQKIEYLSYNNYPDLKISMAIRMSACIPFLFNPVKLNNKLYIDGSVLDTLSVNLCDNKNYLAFYLSTNKKKFNEIATIDKYLLSIINVVIHNLNKNKLKNAEDNIIRLELTDINNIDFEMDKKNKLKMIKKCYELTINKLKLLKKKYNNIQNNENENSDKNEKDIDNNIKFKINEKLTFNQKKNINDISNEINNHINKYLIKQKINKLDSIKNFSNIYLKIKDDFMNVIKQKKHSKLKIDEIFLINNLTI